MKVFGIGLNKTGTTSLGLAFAELGFRHFKRSPAIFRLYRQGATAAIFDHIDDFDSFEDWPWPLMVSELLAHYGPDARFVLTRRKSSEAWLKSIKAHALRTHPVRNPRKAIFGAAYPQGNEALYLAFYERHLKETRARFAADGIGAQMLELCLEEGQGWDALCTFLDLPKPEKPFPRANVSAETDIPHERLMANLAAIEAQANKATRYER